jgi:hypothetical protein
MTNPASRAAPSHELHGHSAYREPIISSVARRFITKFPCSRDVFSVTIVWQLSRSTFVLSDLPNYQDAAFCIGNSWCDIRMSLVDADFSVGMQRSYPFDRLRYPSSRPLLT